MRNRIGNFFLLCGLVCLVIFFAPSTFEPDHLIYLFGGITLLSLGFLIKRGSKKKKRGLFKRKKAEEIEDQEK